MKILTNQNIKYIKKDMLQYIQFNRLLEYSDILVHAIALKKESKEREKMLYEELGLDRKNKVSMHQIHSDIIKIVNVPGINVGNVDGVITNNKNVVLSSVEADCIPILIFDKNKKIIANIHSGWRGTLQQISLKAIKEMNKVYGSEYGDIIVCFGPSILKCHFEVDEDVKEKFEIVFGHNDKIILKGNNIKGKQKYNIDTIMANRIMLESIGVKPDNIIESNLCTVCNSEYMHSYRVEKENYLRNSTLICLK